MNLHEIMLAVQLANKNNGENANLSDYYTKSQADSLISEKVEKNNAVFMQTLGYTATNLLPNRCSSRTAYGVTSTVNADGSITLNGTSNRAFVLYASISDGVNSVTDMPSKKAVPNGNYYLSGDITGKARLQLYLFNGENNGTIKFSGNVIVDDAYSYNCVRVAVENGVNFDNETLYPMLRYAEIEDNTYTQYRPSVEERLTALENAISGGNYNG